MKLPDFIEAQGLAAQRSNAEKLLAWLEDGEVDLVRFKGSARWIEDPVTMDFVRYSLTAFYKEKIASYARALIVLGVEL